MSLSIKAHNYQQLCALASVKVQAWAHSSLANVIRFLLAVGHCRIQRTAGINVRLLS